MPNHEQSSYGQKEVTNNKKRKFEDSRSNDILRADDATRVRKNKEGDKVEREKQVRWTDEQPSTTTRTNDFVKAMKKEAASKWQPQSENNYEND
jgi:hypothetical protein